MRRDGGWGQDVSGPVSGWGGGRWEGAAACAWCCWNHRCDSGWKSFVVPVWRSPERWWVHSFCSEFSPFPDNVQPFVSIGQSKDLLLYMMQDIVALVTEQGLRLEQFDSGVWWRFGTNGAVNKDSGDFIAARRQTQGERIEKELVKMRKRCIYCFNTFV